MTRSPSFRPSLTSQTPSCTAPVRTGCVATRPSSLTTNTSLPPPASRWIACCGTAMASESMPCSIRTRTYMPGSSSRLGFGNCPRSVTWPGIGVHLGFGKQQLAGNRIDRAVVEHEADLGCVGRNPVEIAAVKRPAQLVHLRDRLGEIGVDRVELLDRGETGGVVLHHQRAFAHQRGADDAADRRTDRCIIEIEPGARDVGLAAADLGLGLALGPDGLFVLGLGRRALAGQRRDAPRMLCGKIERSHRLVQRSFARLQFHLERLGIDPVQRIAGLHLGALLEQALDDDARNPRTNI